MENRHGLVVSILVATATGRAEREAAISMLDETDNGRRRTLAADKAYDVRDTVAACRTRNVTPHFAQNVNAKGGSALDARTTRHPGYALSQRVRNRVEEISGWMKTVGGFRKTRYRGLERTQLAAHLVASAYNLLRTGRLSPA